MSHCVGEGTAKSVDVLPSRRPPIPALGRSEAYGQPEDFKQALVVPEIRVQSSEGRADSLAVPGNHTVRLH